VVYFVVTGQHPKRRPEPVEGYEGFAPALKGRKPRYARNLFGQLRMLTPSIVLDTIFAATLALFGSPIRGIG